MAFLDHFAVPKCKTFLFCVPLRSAVELIVFVALINKISGLYGILALFTGYELNATQLTYYLYNLSTFATIAWLASTLKKPEAALKTVALASIYVLDTVINTIYTVFFVASWFSVLAGHLGQEPGLNIPGSGTIEDTAGFTTPEIDASHVDVSTKPTEGIIPAQEATVVASTSGSQPALFESGGLMSLVIIGGIFLVRLYFCLIILSYARGMLRQYIVMTSTSFAQTDDVNLAENPFRAGREEGRGLKGKLGRLLLHFPSQHFWLGIDADTPRQDFSERKPRARQSADMSRAARKEMQ